MPPPARIYDGKTGEAIEVNPDAPWDALSVYLCQMVSLLGYDRAAAYIGLAGATEMEQA